MSGGCTTIGSSSSSDSRPNTFPNTRVTKSWSSSRPAALPTRRACTDLPTTVGASGLAWSGPQAALLDTIVELPLVVAYLVACKVAVYSCWPHPRSVTGYSRRKSSRTDSVWHTTVSRFVEYVNNISVYVPVHLICMCESSTCRAISANLLQQLGPQDCDHHKHEMHQLPPMIHANVWVAFSSC